MKRILIILSLALIGMGLFAYPIVSNYLYIKNASTASQEYNDFVNETDTEKLDRLLMEAIIYNENIEGDPAHDPFLKDSGMVMADNYKSVLDIDGEGTMGYVSIPKISVNLPIYHGTSETVLQKGTGHLEGSSLPIGGPGTHSVVTGHSGLANARIFTDLHKLVIGDIFYLRILDQVLAYQIDQIDTVLPNNISALRRVRGEDHCTLVTCTPYLVNSHRLLIRGTRIEYIPEVEEQLISEGQSPLQMFAWWNKWVVLAAVVTTALVITIAYFIMSSRSAAGKGGAELWAGTPTTGGRKKKKNRKKEYWWEEDRNGS